MSEILTKQELITEIIAIEWDMFNHTQNQGGRASCQEDPHTFEIMRRSQAESWSRATLESYFQDLKEARVSGRNLIAEKYARMMEYTVPSEYAKIQHLLPALEPEVHDLVEQIIQYNLNWTKELAERYPYVAKNGRPLSSQQDTTFVTSLETYSRGELSTYSVKTLKHYLEDVLTYTANKINMAEIILAETAKRYGYQSLDEANEKIKLTQTR